MGQLAIIGSQAPAPVVPNLSMTEIEHIATTIARGGLFGSKDPYAVATLCMLAYAEGQHPVSVFRDYHVISGKPSKKAEAMQRDFLMAGGKIEWHKLEDDCCDATFSHPTGGSARITWDQARVKRAQLGSNAMHSKYPRQMLRARVVSEGVRTVYPGATSGMYVPDEVAGFDDAPVTPPTPQAQRARDLKADAPAIAAPTDKGREKAETWVADQVAQVANAADADALDTIIAGGHKAVAKLAREHHDLHKQVQDAYEARGNQLAGYEPEGPADEQRGDAHDGTDHAATMLADGYVAKLASAAIIGDVLAVQQDLALHQDAMPDADVDRVEAAIEAAKVRLKGVR